MISHYFLQPQKNPTNWAVPPDWQHIVTTTLVSYLPQWILIHAHVMGILMP
jgi:hypothetical protein